MNKVLITGGAGFIGSNLAKALVRDNNKVVVVDDLSMGQIKNLAGLNVEFIEHDVTDKSFMHHLLREYKFDYIFFLAAVASVADSVKRPLETHQINQEAVLDTLEFIHHNNLPLKRFVFTSSAAVYGNLPDMPKSETTRCQPLTPYAVDKYAAERFTIDYEGLYGVPTVAVRFFNVFGPNQNPDSPYSGVLSIITNKLKNNETFNLYGDGSQTRDFVYVADVVKALRLVATKTPKATVYNVAQGGETSLLNLIKMYEKVAGKKLKIKKMPTRNGDISKSVADISKIKSIGFKPDWSLERGLKAYWKYENRVK
ncbi:SDR family NAD(P)-dependent oxidoreductase [Lactobacillus kitasatonis]|uniref:SDR family NAD(P)-dependent oxidoreductase n=1 Tax=Lactobacillus kitasatonis TaxID=237446 RepID=A0ABS1LSY0_9LACO|nr:SDR family NAD(P)-dependent oxidoreductase [Lactobacillus kitasatonis]MBL1071372.1 SDR family NAD(P)-dependent oxidoreductase [Lactobacillus kitasatonis]